MARWSQKDYELVASAIKTEVEHVRRESGDHITSDGQYHYGLTLLECLAGRFADHYGNDNERFDRERFMVAAGLEF